MPPRMRTRSSRTQQSPRPRTRRSGNGSSRLTSVATPIPIFGCSARVTRSYRWSTGEATSNACAMSSRTPGPATRSTSWTSAATWTSGSTARGPRLAPEGATRPRWLYAFAKTGHLPDLTVPNMVAPGQTPPTFFGAYGQWMGSPLPTWDDIAWLASQWGGPFMLKGITRVDDAKNAVQAGVTAISVSNHGGNNLDGTPASIRALPAVAEAVGGQVEVLLDGGIRRGSDIFKALALGAHAVMIGRAHLWGLAANGQAGVENVLDILHGGLDSALLASGHSSIHELTAGDLVIPTNFTRELGV